MIVQWKGLAERYRAKDPDSPVEAREANLAVVVARGNGFICEVTEWFDEYLKCSVGHMLRE
jgi:hypothetical protein